MAGGPVTAAAVEQALQLATVEGCFLFPPNVADMELDAKDYAAFKKLMTDNFGRWKANRGGFMFPFDPACLLQELRAGGRPSYRKDWHYFPTPENVLSEMCNMAPPCFDGRFLEPSAGQGAIVEYIRDEMGGLHHEQEWHLVEPHPVNRGILEGKGFTVHGYTLEEFAAGRAPCYDAVYANPPFKDDTAHVGLMLDLLSEGGYLVCVLPETFTGRAANKALVSRLDREFDYWYTRPIPQGAFSSSGTQVTTTILAAFGKGFDKG